MRTQAGLKKAIRSYAGNIGVFYCDGNPIYPLCELFGDIEKIELFNDYDIIRGDSIVLDRLNSLLEDIGKESVESVSGYKNI